MKINDGVRIRVFRNFTRRSEKTRPRHHVSGNVFFAVFAAVAMVGAVGFGFNTVLRGPISGMTEITRRTVAENTVITASRLSIVGATTYQAAGGDCDNDGMIEPLAFENAGSGPHPAGGGWLPRGAGPPAWALIPNSIDPWKTEYGYCAWDPGTAQADPGCGGTGRLIGSPNKNVQAFVIISAGKNKKFETSCADYNPASPNALLYNKPAGSDDIVLPYSYAEANDLGNGLWTPDSAAPATAAATDKNLEIKGTGTSSFSDVVQLSGAGGLILPGDPGDDSITGACNAANDRQLRRNMSDPANPAIEICDFTGGLGWNPISGGTGGGASSGALSGSKIAHWKFDETSGTTAFDSSFSHNGTLTNGATWSPAVSKLGGAVQLTAADSEFVRVPRTAYLEPTAISGSFWLRRPLAAQSNAALIAKNVNNNAGSVKQSYWIGFTNTGDSKLNFKLGSGGTNTTFFVNYFIPYDTWTHVAFTYDPSLTSGSIKVYIDGTLRATHNYTGEIEYDTTSAGDLYIGASDASGTNAFNGHLDDVRLFNYALSAEEIQQMISSATPKLDTPSSSKAGRLYSWGDDANGRLGNGSVLTNDFSLPQSVDSVAEFVQVSAGHDHACGVQSDKTVWCWGSDAFGKLGNGPLVTADQASPTQVVGLSGVMKVSAGTSNSCALKHDGTVWCWGDASTGIFGSGLTTSTDVPVQLVSGTAHTFGFSNVIDVAAGNGFVCGIRVTSVYPGTVSCIGRGTEGQLGNASSTNRNVPVSVMNVTDFVQISANAVSTQYNICGTTRRGRVFCWGTESDGNFGDGGGSADVRNFPSEILNNRYYRKVEIYGVNACALSGTGRIHCWGDDTNGQLGNGSTTTSDQRTPVVIDDGGGYIDFSVGYFSACGIKTDGSAWCWGRDSDGELGNSTVTTGHQHLPVRVTGGKFSQISAGTFFSVAIAGGQGSGGSVMLPKDDRKIATGYGHACAIEQDGSLWCWGFVSNGQLGNGTSTGTKEIPSLVTDPGPWAQVSASSRTGSSTSDHTCAIKVNGNLYCWGSNSSGQLGIGSFGSIVVSPALVGNIEDLWSQVSINGNTSCGIKSDGTLWCWGENGQGQLTGSGNKSSPAEISGGGIWKKVSVGGTSTCAIHASGTLYCWGSDSQGQLGNGGASLNSSTPVLVDHKGAWLDVSIQDDNACAVKTDGTLWCWGDSGYLLSGTEDAQSPRMVADSGPWVSVSLSTKPSACGLKADGSAWCWGDGAGGVLGNGNNNDTIIPTRVYGGSDWTAIKTANAVTCGMKKDGSAWCWGPDGGGWSGNGIGAAASSVPTRVHQFPRTSPWLWNDNDSYSPPAGANAYLAPTKYMSNDGAPNTGLILGTGGGSALRQPAQPNQLLLDTAGAAGSAQVTLKTSYTGGQQDSISGLAARWKLDESSGTQAADSIGGANGTLTNGPTWVPAGGKSGGSLRFAASSNQHVRAPRSAAVESSSVTVSMWIKRNGAQPGWAGIMSKTHSNNGSPVYQSYGLEFNGASDTQLIWSVGKSGGANSVIMASTIPDNTWTHVVGTYNPAAASANLAIYINGVLDASDNVTDPIVYDTSNTGDIYIGAYSAGSNKYNGEIDDLRIYNRALTSAEISLLYESYGAVNIHKRVIGQDPAGSFVIARDFAKNDVSLSNIPQADLEIDADGNVGLGTGGKPMAKLDINGAVKLGNAAGCSAASAGTLSYNGTALRYCNGSGSWATFGKASSGPIMARAQPGSISQGGDTGCAVMMDGSLRCWGKAANGKLGNNQDTANSLVSQTVHSDVSATGWTDWVRVSVDVDNVCGLRSNGTLWCWGEGTRYGLVNGVWNAPDGWRPSEAHSASSSTGFTDWKQLSRWCAVRANGMAYCWGINDYGKLGAASGGSAGRPNVVTTDAGGATYWSDWVSVEPGGVHACGVRANGTAWCWGRAANGRLGNNTTTPDQNKPVQVLDSAGTGTWSDWKFACAGWAASCGLRADGSIWCWGSSGFGVLGNNTTTPDVSVPVQVRDSTGAGVWNDWKSLACVHETMCGIRANGTAWCWGRGSGGKLGNNATSNSALPVQVHSDTSATGWTDWVALNGLSGSTCGVRTDGSAWCWGPGADGQLGNNSTSNSSRPVRVQ